MSETTTVPVTLPPDAAARLAELGMQREFDQMVDKIRQTVPELFRIEVEVADRMDGTPTCLVLSALSSRSYNGLIEPDKELRQWKVTTFPPEVCESLSMDVLYRESHAG
jgi:hypothetical protein